MPKRGQIPDHRRIKSSERSIEFHGVFVHDHANRIWRNPTWIGGFDILEPKILSRAYFLQERGMRIPASPHVEPPAAIAMREHSGGIVAHECYRNFKSLRPRPEASLIVLAFRAFGTKLGRDIDQEPCQESARVVLHHPYFAVQAYGVHRNHRRPVALRLASRGRTDGCLFSSGCGDYTFSLRFIL